MLPWESRQLCITTEIKRTIIQFYTSQKNVGYVVYPPVQRNCVYSNVVFIIYRPILPSSQYGRIPLQWVLESTVNLSQYPFEFMKIQLLHEVKSKPTIVLQFKESAVPGVLLMHYTDENKLKRSLNSTTRMEVTVKLMEGKMHFYLRLTSMRMSSEIKLSFIARFGGDSFLTSAFNIMRRLHFGRRLYRKKVFGKDIAWAV